MVKAKTDKRSTAISADSKQSLDACSFTIQEPEPGKFKIVLGEHNGITLLCSARGSNKTEDTRKAFLRSIKKTSASLLTQEQVDDFVDFAHEAGMLVKLFTSHRKEFFVRRFRRFLAQNEITLEQIEAQGFSDPAMKRWLRNLHKNGISHQRNSTTWIRLSILHQSLEALGVTCISGF